jgi:drug/metabolite transporter (DMT)-like permease
MRPPRIDAPHSLPVEASRIRKQISIAQAAEPGGITRPMKTEAETPGARPWIILVLGMLCISWSTLWVKLAGVGALASAFWRCALPAILLAPFLPRVLRRMPDRRTLGFCVGAGVVFGFHFCVWNRGILMTDATRGTLYPNMAAFWFTLAAMFFHDEKPSWRVWGGLGLAFAGLIALSAPKLQGGAPMLGDLLCFIVSFSYAAYLLCSKSARKKISAFDFVTVAVPASALTIGAIALVAGTTLTGFSPGSWAALAGLGLMTHLAGSLMLVDSMGRLPSGPASSVILMQSPFAALWAWPVLGEKPDAALAFGGVLMLLGVALATRPATWPRQKKTPQNPLFKK